MDATVDPEMWPDERPDGAVARAEEDPQMTDLKARIEELERHLHEAEDAVLDQDEEIAGLEARLREADAAPDKKRVKGRIDRAVAREQHRVTKEYEARFRDLKARHREQMAELEAQHVEDRVQWEADQWDELQAKDAQIEQLERDRHDGAERTTALKRLVKDLRTALRQAEAKQVAIIAQAAKDVAEAEMYGRVRGRNTPVPAPGEAIETPQ